MWEQGFQHCCSFSYRISVDVKSTAFLSRNHFFPSCIGNSRKQTASCGILAQSSHFPITQQDLFSRAREVETRHAKFFYDVQMEKLPLETPAAVLKWQQDFPGTQLFWPRIFGAAKKLVPVKLKSFHFRFVHRLISCPQFQYNMGFSQSNTCTFCEAQVGTYAHTFWYCSKIRKFWNSVYGSPVLFPSSNSIVPFCQAVRRFQGYFCSPYFAVSSGWKTYSSGTTWTC